MNACQQITGAALSAYLPTFTKENGFEGANAQIATLAPYGSAAVCMVIGSWISDRYKNRGWPIQFGWAVMVLAFGIYLGVPATNHPARFAALILAEIGHYGELSHGAIVERPLIVQYARPSLSLGKPIMPAMSLAELLQFRLPFLLPKLLRESATAIVILMSLISRVGSGYLFPHADSPRYTTGSAVCLALSAGGGIFTFMYQVLIWRENRRRDAAEGGPPEAGFRPDTATYADDAPGFRYFA